RGFHRRRYLWDIAAEVVHELRPGISVTGGYYRNWSGNFLVTDNLAVTPADYSPYCITAPVDPRLPGGGGYPVCGLYDVAPEKFGRVNNLVAPASNYGKSTLVSDFLNVSVNTRLGPGIQLGAGVDTGRIVGDATYGAAGTMPAQPNNSFIIDSPQELLNCRVVTPFRAQTQLKLFGSYRLPGDFTVSGSYENMRGPPILATYAVPNAQIAPSLGRNLAACGSRIPCNATAPVPLLLPQTEFEDRRTQLDLRLSKKLEVGPKVRLQAN